ncbi:MAG: acetyl-CoA carboxylase biotin carboxyl carrier protein subunit [Saprospiraceae bacterium]|nr:acetyl-CoA carboxylase biotin carboxyl carrier protein subunit [Saprospiraceae bacterium]
METKPTFQAICGEHIIHATEDEISEKGISKIAPDTYRILHNNKNFQASITNISLLDNTIELKIGKRKKIIQIKNPIQQLIQTLGYNDSKANHLDSLQAPMPGMVLEIPIQVGDLVLKGDHLITLEAMKMENILKATQEGKIKEIRVLKGDKIEKNQILITFSEK